METYFFEAEGYCPICCKQVTFTANNEWFRDHLLCSNCGSIPRERALMEVICMYYPEWKDRIIHESSPCGRGTSIRLKNECTAYLPTQYYPDIPGGNFYNGIQCENIESMTFDDNSIDIHITQDVMEHVFSPAEAFKEIARTLKPGGAHIFTVPLVNKVKPTVVRAKKHSDGTIEHLLPPVYHDNPVSQAGSLVTTDWGYDIARFIFEACGLFSYIISIDNIEKGIRAEYIEVLVTRKDLK
jgi:SAM-dependent methyltransferase